MAASSVDVPARRSVVPPRAARSIWLAAAWTGAATAVVAAIAAITAVAVCWLPASGAAGNARSALRAGLLTFLAAVHGGITVDGVAADFVPLGMTIGLGLLAWRAGTGLADTAAELEEFEPGRIIGAGLLQALAFALTCALAGRVATLGTSNVPPFGVAAGAFALFLVTGGVALVRTSTVGQDIASNLPVWFPRATRAALAVVTVYLVSGALIAAASLAVHHERVTTLSAQVGGGWSGVPILLLGTLAAPNAVIAGSSYLAGPGFAVGTGNGVSLSAGAHGVLPAFPILGGVPAGSAGPWAWILAALTFVIAGGCGAALIARSASEDRGSRWTGRLADIARAAVITAVLGVVLAWQGGGAIGGGRLSAVGVSPWRLGAAFAAITVIGGAVGLGVIALADVMRDRSGPAGRLHVLAERANAAADVAADRLEASRSVVDLSDEEDGQARGLLRSTWSSVTHAVTTTDDERAAG